ncbi:RNF181 protein [Hibiscus syriacus]|uniref:RING-type E3 ubiquitin transferase n=1 Tax=Hibiscus syriacus TaxID=106335 RepID=A0A6A2YC63_HIBSY|nr:RNF181 protein [Hibiscus syriacus]
MQFTALRCSYRSLVRLIKTIPDLKTMSFDGNVTGGGNAVTMTSKHFFCYQCNHTVDVPISSSDDPSCPECNDGFLEECDNTNPNPGSNFHNPNPFSDSLFSSSDPFFSFIPLLSTMNSSPSPASVDLPSSRRSGIFHGPGLEQLIQRLAENDPNRYGTPPASKSAIDSLPSVKIAKDLLNSKSNQCAVCMDDFEEGIEGKRMPCQHLYHKDCILPWLELHNSCPVCRHELPTDDPDYERRARGGQGTSGGNAGADNVQSSARDNRTVERSFRISLPWSFQAQASGSGSADNADTMQEDLD